MSDDRVFTQNDGWPGECEPEADLRTLFAHTAPQVKPVDVEALFAAADRQATAQSRFFRWPTRANQRSSEIAGVAFSQNSIPKKVLQRRTVMFAKIAAGVLFVAGAVGSVVLVNLTGRNVVLANVQKALKKV